MKTCRTCKGEFDETYVNCAPCREKHRVYASNYARKNKDRTNAQRRQKNTKRYGIKSCQTCKQNIPYNGNNRSYSKMKYCSHECRPCEDKEHRKTLRIRRRRAKGVKPRRFFANEEERQAAKKARINTEEYRRERREYARTSRARENKRKWRAHKRATDVMYKINNALSVGLWGSLKGNKKGKRTWEILPFTKEEFMAHMENHFTDGMSWENYGLYGWHIDHIRPKSSFNFTTTDCEDFKKCWALENLQPLWAADNMNKGNKWDGVVNA